MRLTLQRGLALLALGAAGGVALGVSLIGDRTTTIRLADHFIHPDIDVYFRAGPVTGVVYGRQVRTTRRVRVDISLHGLDTATTYRVVASRRPCSRSESEATRVFVAGFVTGAGEDDAYRVRTVLRRTELLRTRSVRILVRNPDGALAQRLCGGYNTGTGTLT